MAPSTRLTGYATMPDLFDIAGPELLPVRDAELVLWRSPDLGIDPGTLLAELIANTPWRAETVKVWGKFHPQPRLIAWYGDRNRRLAYAGITLGALPWTPTLAALKQAVERFCGHAFNSVLLNYYRDQHDSVGMHSDDESELGKTPVIASLSVGAVRTLVFRHKHDTTLKSIKLPLPSGSLLLMKGATQANWKHGIPKQSQPCGPRVNLTFRQVRVAAG